MISLSKCRRIVHWKFVTECSDTKLRKTPDTSECKENFEEDQEQAGDNWIIFAHRRRRKIRLMKLRDTPLDPLNLLF